ncbi:MAG TPA: neutral/alkaline non-lysosomal ceramidase N-terminal domain-containing protein, partial [Clostridiales bacterium]|nr:neutral/alkaline non-lysosomal ceramidase N-terminal domain-containing protein [Clostridiales bacterium]
LTLLVSCATAGFSAGTAGKSTMYVGVGSADITGPITSISNGYNSLGDLIEGLSMRLNARAFIVKTGKTAVAYCSVELVHMTESIKPMVLKELKSRGLSQYGEENLMISATHCHSSGSNNSWYGLYDLINGVPGYDDEATDLIVNGIADAIEAADKDLAPGSVTLSYADTDIDSYNRSLAAAKWNNNYDGSKYKNDFEAACKTVSKEMSVLSFAHNGEGDIGMLCFFPSHGTSNPIDNIYLSADHKGYAAYYVEKTKGNGYVAAFAQNECGDVSPNKPHEDDVTEAFQRPAEVDSSLDPIENQIAAGQQEANAALAILKGGKGITTMKLTGQVRYNYEIVDYSNISVDKKYIGSYKMDYDDVDNAKTSDPCIGAGIIAGDEEGAPVDNAEEGAVRNNYYLDKDGNVVREDYDFSSIDLYGLEAIAPQIWPIAM